jgi:tRNA pseudouridine38-40 synthase
MRPAAVQTMNCYKLILEYDGTNYSGWQEQKNARTIAGEIRKVAEKVLNAEVELNAAGRTDAGVHALMQVARIKCKKDINAEKFMRELNRSLPKDINVLDVSVVAAQFHPRHDAKLRSYLYQIALRRTAFSKRYVWWIQETLDIERMKAASSFFVGRHDYERFADKRSEDQSTIVIVQAVDLAIEGDVLLIRIVASHFLWRMVRRMVGTLAQIGLHKIAIEQIPALLEPSPLPRKFRSFSIAANTAPASGLFLEWIQYKDNEIIPPLKPAIAVRKYES